MRTIALTLLLAIALPIALPAFAPAPAYASASAGATIEGGLPPPWPQIGQWILKNALMLLMLAEEIWRDMTGGSDRPPGTPPPTPTPSPHVLAEPV